MVATELARKGRISMPVVPEKSYNTTTTIGCASNI